MTYAPLEKNFYVEHEEIRHLSDGQVDELRRKHGVNVRLWMNRCNVDGEG